MTNGELKVQVLEAVKANHIWLNAMSLRRPSDEMLMVIGRKVVEMLNDPNNLLPAWSDDCDGNPVDRLQEMNPTLYLRINAS